jgi:hypothetical protein
MTFRTRTTFAALWRESWFFRANVVLAAVGVVYLLTR